MVLLRTIEWFVGSLAESAEALAELGRRQAEMHAARADSRRGELSSLVDLQKEAFGGFADRGYRSALFYLVGRDSSSVDYPSSFENGADYCNGYDPYSVASRVALRDPSHVPTVGHWCFKGCTVDAGRADVARAVDLLRTHGQRGASEMAVELGVASLGELGISDDAYEDALLYLAEDRSLAGLYPDGVPGARLPVPTLAYRSQLRLGLPGVPVTTTASRWDELSVSSLMEIMDKVVATIVPSKMTEAHATSAAVTEALRSVRDLVAAEVGAVRV